jgi:hypothetical protein
VDAGADKLEGYIAYRDSCPDTTTTRVKNVALLACWTWMVFLIVLFWVEDLLV